MHLQENILFDLDSQNVAQYPLHHVTNAPANFEVATSNSLERGGGGGGGGAGKIFTTMFLHFLILFNLICNMTMFCKS